MAAVKEAASEEAAAPLVKLKKGDAVAKGNPDRCDTLAHQSFADTLIAQLKTGGFVDVYSVGKVNIDAREALNKRAGFAPGKRHEHSSYRHR